MDEKKEIFKYSARNSLSLPKWVEILVVIVEVPIVLGIMYIYVFPLVDNLVALITFIIIILLGIWLAFRSEEVGDISFHIRADEYQINCKLGAKTSTYDLRKLDWSKVEMTTELLSSLILKEEGIDNERSFPISLMSKADRRELWDKITRYRK